MRQGGATGSMVGGQAGGRGGTRAEEKETAATFSAVSALREALFGNADEARRRATLAMARSTGRDVQYGAALALAYAGDGARYGSEDLHSRRVIALVFITAV